MLSDPALSYEQKQSVYKIIERRVVGDSVQDTFLEQVFVPRLFSCLLGSRRYGFPKLVYPSEQYSCGANYRTIRTGDDACTQIHIGFQYPIADSPLYMGTFDKDLGLHIQSILQKNFLHYRATPLHIAPLTFKVAMDVGTPSGELYLAPGKKQTLRYLDEVLSAETILDVVDMDGMPEDILAMIQ
jgi:hypothetical protein